MPGINVRIIQSCASACHIVFCIPITLGVRCVRVTRTNGIQSNSWNIVHILMPGTVVLPQVVGLSRIAVKYHCGCPQHFDDLLHIPQ